MPSRPIYLDYNATTPLLPEVVDAMLPYLTTHFGNPSSGHGYGVQARRAVEKAREQVASLLGADADEVVFTGSGTEANNLAIRGAVAAQGTAARHVILSAVEHPATEQPCRALEREGLRLTRLPVGSDGVVALGAVDAALEVRGTALLTLMHSNNETGALQPVAEVAKRARRAGVLVHTDAAQSVGKLPLDVRRLEVDLLSLAGHKLYAPKGVGALFVRRGVKLEPLVRGGGQEHGLRPGTENVASIVGLGKACELARRSQPGTLAALAERLLTRLREGIPGLQLNGPERERLPNTLNVSAPGVRGADWLARAPELAASTGSACHSGHDEPSAVLTAMGLDHDRAMGAVRLTVGRMTTEDEIDRAAEALVRAWRER
ncbi:MAG: cysteine desulfurase family protein [Myxococcales bacterium]